ncbi:MAG: DUF6279 family lipoprotein [Burkholderiales bacterium]
MPLFLRVARIVSLGVLALVLVGCGGMVRLAYNNGDIAARFAADDYLSLDAEQLDALRPQIAKFHVWHRRIELPQYAVLATAAADRVGRGVTAADVSWAVDSVRSRYRMFAAQAVDDAVPLLARLNAENIAALEKKLAASTDKLEREYAGRDEANRIDNRMTAVRKRIEEWLGAVTPEQDALITEYVKTSPQFSGDRFADRRKRQREFVAILREHRGAPEIAAKLKAYFMNPEATRSVEYAKSMQEWEQGLARLVVGVDRTASPEQRGRVVQRLARYAEDFRVLAGVGRGGAPVATVRGASTAAVQ